MKPKAPEFQGDVSDLARVKGIELSYMRMVEQKNKERVERLLQARKFNRRVGLSLGATVVGIYLYTIFAIRQETFLDDFNLPEVVKK